MEIIRKLFDIEPGKHAYIEGSYNEIKTICDDVGDFLVLLVGENMCKVTRIKPASSNFSKDLDSKLSSFDGNTIVLDTKPASYIRMMVSKYNKRNGTSFKVSALKSGACEITSDDKKDIRSLTKYQYGVIEREFTETLNLLHKRIKTDEQPQELEHEEEEEEYEDQDEEITEHDPAIFVTQMPVHQAEDATLPDPLPFLRECERCDEEFTTRNASQKLCNDCEAVTNDEEDII